MMVSTLQRKGNEAMKIEIGENLPAYFKPATRRSLSSSPTSR